MLRDRARELLLERNFNCAETMLLLCDEAFHLNLSQETFRAAGVFGGGLASGELCGAVAASCAVLGMLFSDQKFNLSPDCKRRVHTFITRVRETLGDTQCRALRPQYFEPEIRCLRLVEQVADLLEEIAKE